MELTFEWDEEKAQETTKQANVDNDDMRSEYDFKSMKGGVRGKHYRAMQAGYTVTIHKADGSTLVKEVKPVEGTVMLQPDVREYFPDSEAVNTALRSLITLMAQMPSKSPKGARRKQQRFVD